MGANREALQRYSLAVISHLLLVVTVVFLIFLFTIIVVLGIGLGVLLGAEELRRQRFQLVQTAAEELHAAVRLQLHRGLVISRRHLDEPLQEEAHVAFFFQPRLLPGLVRVPEPPGVKERRPSPERRRRLRRRQSTLLGRGASAAILNVERTCSNVCRSRSK